MFVRCRRKVLLRIRTALRIKTAKTKQSSARHLLLFLWMKRRRAYARWGKRLAYKVRSKIGVVLLVWRAISPPPSPLSAQRITTNRILQSFIYLLPRDPLFAPSLISELVSTPSVSYFTTLFPSVVATVSTLPLFFLLCTSWKREDSRVQAVSLPKRTEM